MTGKRGAEPKTQGKQIVGFRLQPDVAREIKMEAARRGMKLNAFLVELWNVYRQQKDSTKR